MQPKGSPELLLPSKKIYYATRILQSAVLVIFYTPFDPEIGHYRVELMLLNGCFQFLLYRNKIVTKVRAFFLRIGVLSLVKIDTLEMKLGFNNFNSFKQTFFHIAKNSCKRTYRLLVFDGHGSCLIFLDQSSMHWNANCSKLCAH